MTDPDLPATAAASRSPVVVDRVRELLQSAPDWTIRTVTSTGSTNDDLAAVARGGGFGRQVLIAELQETGKGRLGRTWTAPAGSGLTMSVLLELPGVPLHRRSWIGAIAGLCLIDAVTAVAGLPATAPATLKWPNDLLVGGRKCAGLLAEATSAGVVLGMGLNVSLQAAELPRPDATSLLLAGARGLDRAVLAAAVLDGLARWLDRWQTAGGDPDRSGLRPAYRSACATLGAPVRVELPSGEHVLGRAVDVTIDGSLEVESATGRRVFSAADVHHLRPGDEAGPTVLG